MQGNKTTKNIFSALDTVIKAAVELDSSPANLIHEKLNIPPENRSAAGEKLKKLYTNNSFFKDVEATISVSIFLKMFV